MLVHIAARPAHGGGRALSVMPGLLDAVPGPFRQAPGL